MQNRSAFALCTILVLQTAVHGQTASSRAGADADAVQCRTPSASAEDVAAVVGEREIRVSDVDKVLGARLAKIRSDEYQLRSQVLADLIDQALLAKEAQRRGITVDQLLEREVKARVKAVPESSVQAVFDAVPERYQGLSRADAEAQIRGRLQAVSEGQRRKELLATLRTSSTTSVRLKPFRADIAVDDDPSLGPADAPVTIVEFSDFQCPYCSRSASTVKELAAKFKGQVRVVYRDFPLSIHKDAPKAAEAAGCAAKQGRFWEMHDLLFANQQVLGVENLKGYARQIGLDTAAFDRCLTNGELTAEWQHDMKQGGEYGVSGTPTFFINGRLLSGAATLEAMSAIVEEELARASSAGAGAGATRSSSQPD